MLHGVGASRRREGECPLYKQASEAMTDEDDGPLEPICQLAIRAKLSDETVRKWQYSIGGAFSRR